MNNKNYHTSITVEKSPAAVFAAINKVGAWWQGDIKGNTGNLLDLFIYQMGGIHFSKQQVVELIAEKKIVWLVTESNINFVADKNEWLGTKIIFDIQAEGDKTTIRFTHEGLVPAIECYGGCSGAWEQLIEKSLYSLIMTGKGVNVF